MNFIKTNFYHFVFGIFFGFIIKTNVLGYLILGTSHYLASLFNFDKYVCGLKDKCFYQTKNDFKLIEEFILTQNETWKARNIWSLNILGLILSSSVWLGLVFCSFFDNKIPFIGSLVLFIGLPMGYIYNFAFDICEKFKIPKLFTQSRAILDIEPRENGLLVGKLLFEIYFCLLLLLLLWN